MSKSVKIQVDNKIIERVPKFHQVGNFCMATVRYQNKTYLIGDGDEYIRDGYDQVFSLGKEIE